MYSEKKIRIGNEGGAIAGLYDLENTIGQGHYAVVKMGRHVFTGEKVAVKIIDKLKLNSLTRLQLLQEVSLMKLVQHPNVVRLYDVIESTSKLYLILELADGGDLYDYIMSHEDGLEEQTAKIYFRQIVRAIHYCHKLHVVHRDLKPENAVFFKKLGIVKLTDFGFSNKFLPGEPLQTSCGSLAYSAPEILLGDAYDAPAVDVWSLGVILYMLVCGEAPFQEDNDSETLTMIMDCKYSFPEHVSPNCKKLISSMLQRKPHIRASLEDIIKDPWLLENTDDSSSLMELPLVSREHLSEEDHTQILIKMVNGAIATGEEIIGALDRDEYNHITATYFLLAEKKLRGKRMALAKKMTTPLKQGQNISGDNLNSKKSSPSDNTIKDKIITQTSKLRQCSIVEEEEEEEEGNCCTTSAFFTSEESPTPFPISSQIGLSRQGSLRRSRCEDSSPEQLSFSHDSFVQNPLESVPYSNVLKSRKSVLQRFEKRKILHRSRTQSSASSSEASDDDSDKKFSGHNLGGSLESEIEDSQNKEDSFRPRGLFHKSPNLNCIHELDVTYFDDKEEESHSSSSDEESDVKRKKLNLKVLETRLIAIQKSYSLESDNKCIIKGRQFLRSFSECFPHNKKPLLRARSCGSIQGIGEFLMNSVPTQSVLRHKNSFFLYLSQ